MFQKSTILFFLFFSVFKLFGQKKHEPIPLLISDSAINQGIRLHDQEKFKEAIAKYEQVLPGDSNYLLAQTELVLSLNSNKEYDKAIKVAQNGLKYPSSYRLNFYEGLSSAYDYKGEPKEAIRIYNEAKKEFPLSHKLWFEEGVTNYRMDNDSGAVRCFQQALQLSPFHASSHFYLGLISLKNGNYTCGYLSFMMFWALEVGSERGQKSLSLIENVATGEFKVNPDSIMPLFKDGNEFAEIDQIITSKAALNEKYKLKVKLNFFNLLKPMQAVLENLHYNPSDKGFWNQTYVPFFEELWKKDYFEAFALFILNGIPDEDIEKAINKKSKDIQNFKTWAKSRVDEISGKRKFFVDGKWQEFDVIYFDNGFVKGFGNWNESAKTLEGKWKFFYPTGGLKAVGLYKNGKKEGEWKSYNENGNLDKISNMKNDLQDGKEEVFYDNGEKSQYATYVKGEITGEVGTFYKTGAPNLIIDGKNGQRNGRFIEFDDFGNKISETSFKEGKQEGNLTLYYRNGIVKSTLKFVNDLPEGDYKRYYLNGKIAEEGKYVQGQLSGKYTIYFQNGKVKEESNFEKGKQEGEEKQYYETGVLSGTTMYHGGNIDGLQKSYRKDGTLQFEAKYSKGWPSSLVCYDKTGKEIFKSVEKKGKMDIVVFYDNGVKQKEYRQENDNLEGEYKEYFYNGNLMTLTTYKKGKKDGPYSDYYSSGQVEVKGNYKDNEPDGYWTEYYKNGNIREEGWYVDGERFGQFLRYFSDGKLSSSKFYQKGGIVAGPKSFYDAKGRLSAVEEYQEECFMSFVAYDTLGNPSQTLKFKNGSGLMKFDFKSNKTQMIANYKYNNKDGESKQYYSDGSLKEVITYAFGTLHGPLKRYHLNGKLSEQRFFYLDDEDSVQTTYDRNGNLNYKAAFKNGVEEGKVSWFYPNGQVETEGEYLHGRRTGQFKYFAPDGSLQMVRFYEDDWVIGYSYNGKDGKLLPMIPFANGAGEFKAFYPNGQVSFVGAIKNGRLEGEIKSYDPNGKLLDSFTRKDNESVGKSFKYFPGGVLQEEASYQDDQLNGLCKWYNDKGKLEFSENFILGRRFGLSQLYDANGKVVKKQNYYDDEPID